MMSELMDERVAHLADQLATIPAQAGQRPAKEGDMIGELAVTDFAHRERDAAVHSQ